MAFKLGAQSVESVEEVEGRSWLEGFILLGLKLERKERIQVPLLMAILYLDQI